MGVNFVLVFILIAISCINAQEYVVFDQSDIKVWDVDDQNPIFFDQNEHIIHRREAPETDLEGSGEIDTVPAIPQVSTDNEPSKDLENKASPPNPSLVEEAQEKNKEESAISEVSLSETSTDLKNEASPPQDNPVEQAQKENEEVIPQISNFREENLAIAAEETSKSNDTKTESPQLSVEAEKVQPVESLSDVTTSAPKLSTSESPKIEAPLQPEAINVVSTEEDVQKVANNETVNPTRTPESINKEKPLLPPLVHSTSGETTVQKDETTLKPKQSSATNTKAAVTETLPQSIPVSVTSAPKADIPIVQEKEVDVAINFSNSENKESVKEAPKKDTPKVLPSDLAEEESNKQKESESVNEQQSGNAILLKSPKGDAVAVSQVEGSESDKTLQAMAENAKISNEPTDQPSTGESAKNVSRASKDTTILVVLFVVVIAIGGAAFTHNFIKKRKQNASADNDPVNGIRRSLQNLTSSNGKTNTDVEQGTELKPLMKDNSNTTKEYVDSKKELEA